MYCYKYPHPAVTTDCIIFSLDGEEWKILLIKRKNEPFKDRWAFPGGFLNPEETADTGALRELEEETGVKNATIEQLHTYTNPHRDPRERVITIAYVAIIKMQDVKANDDAKEANWFSISNLPPLAFDHEEILKDALEWLKQKNINLV